jgi:integrase
MASLRKQAKGNSWQLRLSFSGKRIIISLPDLSEAQAEDWRIFTQAIVDNLEKKRPRDRATNEWLDRLSRDQRKKLSEAGLIESDEPEKEDILLAEYLKTYFETRKSDIKGSTMIAYTHSRSRLEEFFKGRTVKSISGLDAKKFKIWLEKTNKRDNPTEDGPKSLALNTVRRRIGNCKQFFKQAIEDGLIERNPFSGLSASVRSNKERQSYIELEVFGKALEFAPNARWRALLILARLGALRVPSEATALRWEDISWESKRISIIGSSKTEHHAKRAIRIVPLLPSIEKELLRLFVEVEDGGEFVFPGLRADSNLRQGLLRILKRAGIKVWPKLWQNLRASGATDFARSLPSHVAAEICGHTEQIAQEHYWQVSDSDLDLAISKLSPGIEKKLATKLAQDSDSKGLESSFDDSRADLDNDGKALNRKAFVAFCRSLSPEDFSLLMGGEGLEPPTFSV